MYDCKIIGLPKLPFLCVYTVIFREVALKWSAIQDLFKQSIAYSALINEDTLQTAEIALIAVAAVVFLGAGVTIFIVCRQWNM